MTETADDPPAEALAAPAAAVASAASVASVRALLRRGEFLEAYDLAHAALSDDEGEARAELLYLAILSLARSGATDEAVRRLPALREAAADETGLDPRLVEDMEALEARVAKDRALDHVGDKRRSLAAVAAQLYEDVYVAHGGSYPGINAATMWLLAGDPERSEPLATAALSLASAPEAVSDDAGDEYWRLATIAEAQLLLGDLTGSHETLVAADAVSQGDHASRASTCRQLQLICDELAIDRAVLDPLTNPRVIHFAGHRVAAAGAAGRFVPAEVDRVTREVRAALAERSVGFGFGSLASGADIIIAEELLGRGAELHVVLPFSVDEFCAVSVADSGPDWVRRFEACLERATSVRMASDGDYLGDPVMFDFCSGVAMGEALHRARDLATDVEQLAVWDGEPVDPATVAGTAVDVARWASLGLTTRVIDSARAPALGEDAGERGVDGGGDSGSMAVGEVGDVPHLETGIAPRVVRAMLFADVAGFSKLGDAQIATFMDDIMGALASCIHAFGEAVLVRQTWGDGIYLVFDDVVAAAECALGMQDHLKQIDLEGLGLSALRGMRIGAHVGPVFEGWDHICDELNFFGANVTRAARIEPRTPEGEVYVTQPFAAMVALHRDAELRCQYVGRMPAAKDYGTLAMYVLKRIGGS